MLDEKTILEKTSGLEPKERAAALAHYVYILTSQRLDQKWKTRVATEWSELSEEARDFNLASAETWAESREILKAWHDAIQAMERE